MGTGVRRQEDKYLKCSKVPKMPKVEKQEGRGYEICYLRCGVKKEFRIKESGGRSFTIRIPQSKIRNTELLTPVV